MADPVRVALLARPGAARDQVHKALTELGATLVAEGDPADLDPDEVARLKPNLMLVSLEPAIESALERFDDLLSTDGVEVMYDDAEVTRQLEGWDLNRWARHIASKLLGRDLMPPAPDHAPAEQPDLQPVPGAPPTPAQLMDNEKLEDYAAESPDLAEWVPTNPSLTEGTPAAAVDEAPRQREADEMPDFQLDLGDIESAMQGMPQAEEAIAAAPAPAASSDVEDFNFGDLSLELGGLEELIGTEPTPEPEPAADEPLLADLELAGGTMNFSSFSDDEPPEAVPGMDDDVAALAAQLEAFEKTDTREIARDPDFSWATNDNAAKAPEQRATPASNRPAPQEVAAPPASSFDFGSLSLQDENNVPPPPPKAAVPAADLGGSFNFSLAPLDEPPPAAVPVAAAAAAPAAAPKVSFSSTLSLEDDEPKVEEPPLAAQPGAVLVVAGMGGPDAVRQFLSHLPHQLPVPVLLYQHLEVGKHERLVDQLAKISRLPVYLAVAGETAQPGKVAVLRAGMAADVRGDTIVFADGSLDALVGNLPPGDSILVLLSGADPALVPAAQRLRNGGGKTIAQTPDSCFDATAAQALVEHGGTALPAAQLAGQVAARWPT
jgi:chemotaxis response regulator CheB